MRKFLIAVDMQNDFIDGALGTPEALGIVGAVKTKIEGFDGEVIFTRDTHYENYLESSEGKKLPVEHFIKGTQGWEIRPELDALREGNAIYKPTFGSKELFELLASEHEKEPIDEITLIGLCTDICVISNAIGIKAFLPEVKIVVDSSCCAGVTPASHENALNAMKMCQIEII
ncbi:MAG: cysteine hydrolase [Clostridia bacterium]|nr:cysteine hydrolase [Clostridia bacterium]